MSNMRKAGGTPSSSPSGTLGKPVTTELNINKFSSTSSAIEGTTGNLSMSLKELETVLKRDQVGKAEYALLLKKAEIQKIELQKRISENKEWIATYGASGGAEDQFKELISNIKLVYGQAKESHAKGINMLVEEFDYHVAYKRWSDTFSSTPFKPK